jgi:hypothetical protein
MKHVDERAIRAAARAGWAGAKTTLEAQGASEDLSGFTTVEQRLGMMWELAQGAWALTGQPMPTYSRAETPGRVLRPAE